MPMLSAFVLLARLLVPESPEAIGRAVARDLGDGRFAAVTARFGPELAAALPEERLRQVWSGLGAQVGALRQARAPRTEPLGEATVVTVPLEFERMAIDLKVTVGRDGRLTGLFLAPGAPPPAPWSAPAYADPKAFTEEEVTVGREWPLPGTLTLPRGAAKAPAVVLVHGSGPHDRNETVGANRPFQDLAWGLASRGIAVLRYEKRTKAFPGRVAALQALTVREETMDDARTAVALLRARSGIDPARVVLLGHSLGGTLAPRIAREEPGIAALVLLAPAARPLPDLMVEQAEHLASLGGGQDAESKARLEQFRKDAEKARNAKAGDPPVLGAPGAYWADLNAFDPAAAARGLAIPILLLQGGRDYQVGSKDVARFRAALADRPNATLRELPALNHLFVAGEGKSTPAEYQRPGHVDAAVVEAIAAFVKGLSAAR